MRKHWMVAPVLAAVGTLAAIAPAMAAGSGYGPAGPVSTSVPGGYTSVVTTETLQPSTTAQTVSVTVAHSAAQLTVPGEAFSKPVQIVITAPDLASITTALSSLHLAGYQAIAGLGVGVDAASGLPLTGTFGHALTITVHNAAIQVGDKVVEWNQKGTFSTVSAASVQTGVATWGFSSDPAFAIVAPPHTVAGATSPVTGEPFAVVGGLGAIAVGAGAVLLRRAAKSS